MNYKKIAAAVAAFAAALTLSGCASAKGKEEAYTDDITEERTDDPEEVAEIPEAVQPAETQIPTVKNVAYLCVTGDGVAIRSGSGVGFTALGTAERNTLYSCLGKEDGWYKTQYKNKTAYISSKFCVLVDMPESGNKRVEAVIAEGAKHLGTPYVYGAARCHDGNGNPIKGFTTQAFDCSSLMQYAFYKGADCLLQVNTRTQIYQGETVKKSQLERGDLMFFTNASRKNNTGIERVGHVALYLGGSYILHTASDYAKIEKISSARWDYFIQGQRIL